jgi:hypothetical protein
MSEWRDQETAKKTARYRSRPRTSARVGGSVEEVLDVPAAETELSPATITA